MENTNDFFHVIFFSSATVRMKNITPLATLAATFVAIFHTLVVLFTLVAPFTESTGLLVLHVTWCITLLIHWVHGSNACALTMMESKLRGLHCDETFMHRLISPIYDIKEDLLSKISYIVTIILMIYSVYKLYMSEKFNKLLSNIRKGDHVMKNIQQIFVI